MKKMLPVLLIAAVALGGCSTTSDYENYIKAQSDANRLATESQKPLVRLTAQPGQPITGLASLEVFMPVQTPIIQQQRPSEWVGLFGQGLSVAGTVLGIKYAGQAASNLADSVGKYSTAGYSHVQAPGAVVTTSTVTTSAVGDNSGTNSGNSGRIAGSAMSDSTSTPTVVNQPAPVVVMQPSPVVVGP